MRDLTITDPDGVILDSNNAFTRITGYSVEESRGQTPAMLSSGQHDHEFYRRMWQSLRRQGYWSGEIWNRRKNGDFFGCSKYPECKGIINIEPKKKSKQTYKKKG